MKTAMKSLVKICPSVFFVFLLSYSVASAQCDADRYTNKCLEKLTTGYTFMKSYKIDGNGGNKPKVEYSYVFSKGTNYMVTLANKDPELKGMSLSLYDSSRKLVASNKVDNKYFSAIGYTCAATGIYYLTFSFDETQDYCAAAVLGFNSKK